MPENRRRRHHEGTSDYYIEGSAVRKIDTLPEEVPYGYRRSSDEERQRDAVRRRNREISRKNRERALRLDFTYTIFLVCSVVVTVAACVCYLSLQNDIMRTGEEIAALKSELNTLTNENMAAEERINSAVDLSQVYQMAVGEFGMTAITEGQIHYYSNENQDYVKQYEQIPTDD